MIRGWLIKLASWYLSKHNKLELTNNSIVKYRNGYYIITEVAYRKNVHSETLSIILAEISEYHRRSKK